MVVKKSLRRISMNQEKICNVCGEYCLVYSIDRNAPICQDCMPIKKSQKKIMNESQMISKILLNSQRQIQESLPIEISKEE